MDEIQTFDGIAYKVEYEFYKGRPMCWSGPMAGPAEPPELCDFTITLKDFDGLDVDVTEVVSTAVYESIYQQTLEQRLYGGDDFEA